MDINSTLTDRADQSESVGAVMFTIAGHLLALPITAIHRVMKTPNLVKINSNGISLANLDGFSITVLDLHPQLSTVPPTRGNFLNYQPENQGKFLVVTYSQPGMLNGILVDEPPTIMELPLSAIRTFSGAYLQATPLSIASHIAVLPQADGDVTIFLLNISRLLELVKKQSIVLPKTRHLLQGTFSSSDYNVKDNQRTYYHLGEVT